VTARIPVALVGAGKHGARYLRHIVEDAREFELRVLCRRDEQAGREQAQRVGARFVGDFHEAARAADVEAVIAVVPPTLNAEICVAAARAGKALLVEKPLAVTTAEGLEIRRAVQSAAVPAMMAHTLRFNSVVRAARDAAQRLGPIHQVCLSQRFEPSRLDWIDDPRRSGGGNVLHTGVHSFDLLRFFTARDALAVCARVSRLFTARTEDNFVALFGFDGPLLGAVAGSRATASRSGAIEIVAERGQIVADHVGGSAVRIVGTRREPLAVDPPVHTVVETLRAFAALLRGARPAPITLDDGLWAVAMAQACYRSAESQRLEPIAFP
jgi:predicted dehydrogenase